MKKLILLLPLILVVLTSGCAVPGLEFLGLGGPQVKEYENEILVIKSIQAIPDTVAPGQTFRIIAYVENKGSDSIPQKEELKGTTLEKEKIVVDLYDYCEGLFVVKDMKCSGDSSTDKTECTIDKILPGQIIEVDWEIVPDDKIKLETRCPLDGMKVLVKYPYKTESLSTITIMDEIEMQRQIEEGTFRAKESYIVAGQGPIKPFFYVEDQQPISQASKTTVVALQVENKGSGFLSMTPDPANPKDPKKVAATIKIGNVHILVPNQFKIAKAEECSFGNPQASGDKKNNRYDIKEEIRLIYSKSPKLLCKLTLPEGNIAKEITYTSTVDIEYLYEFRSKVNVVVSPKM